MAVNLGTGSDVVVNTGTIQGDVVLDVNETPGVNIEGNDLFDSSGGLFFGKVFGQGGNDTLRGGKLGEAFDGGTGNDSIISGGGNDIIFGQAGDDALSGSDGNDTIFGNDGADIINGGVGKDSLFGGAGKDTFVFNAKPSSINTDLVKDFNRVDDTFKLENAVFTKIGSAGKLKADALVFGKKAADAEDRVIYDKGTGSLFYDADGTGKIAAIKIAQLTNKATLTLSDFIVI